MKPKSIGVGILGGTALVFGGVDASKLDETPIERIETVAGYQVEAKQIGNVVEADFPWKDQPSIKVTYDLGEPSLLEKFADKRKHEVITETVTDFDGGFKVDILLNEKPNTNVFCYAIQGAENYDFFYQPPLTKQEIADGASRSPEIEGSYAVYHKTLKEHIIGKENYATGKVMHIPRPQVWSMSDVETKVWADMHYDNGSLCVTVPQDFLDKAEYPVRVDPTFGYTSVGASANLVFGSSISQVATTTDAGTATSMSVYSGAYTTSGRYRYAFYEKGATYAAQTLKGYMGAAGTLTNTSPQWRTGTLDSGDNSLSASTPYILFYGADDDMDTYYYDSMSSYFWATYSRSPTSLIVTSVMNPLADGIFPTGAGWSNSGNTRKISMYITYTASGGGGSPTVPNQDIILFD